MALATKSARASLDAIREQVAQKTPPLVAGEDLAAFAPCYIKSADGLVYESDGTAANEAAEFHGVTATDIDSGEPVTLIGAGAFGRYSDGFAAADSLSPGDMLYIAATAGRFDDTATTGDAVGTAVIIDDYNIMITRNIGA